MSINLVVASPTRVVACADSRVCFSDPAIPTADNGAQKLFQAGERSILGYVGIGALTGLNYDSDQRDNPRKLLAELSAYHGQLVASSATQTAFLKRIMAGTPVVFSAWALTRKESGEIEIAELKFPLRDRGDGTPHLAEPELMVATLMPKPKLVFCNPPDPEFDPFTATILRLAGEINPNDPDADILAEVDRVFAEAIRRDPACALHIGGTIATAVIDEGGFRWLRKSAVSEATQ